MKIAAFINAGSLSPYALEPLAGGDSAFERSLDFVSGLPGLERTVVAQGSRALPKPRSGLALGEYSVVARADWSFDHMLGDGRAGEGLDAVLLAWADEPFLDRELAGKMIEDFRRYRAEYGFADGYPGGLSAELLSPRAIPAIRDLAALHFPRAIARLPLRRHPEGHQRLRYRDGHLAGRPARSQAEPVLRYQAKFPPRR